MGGIYFLLQMIGLSLLCEKDQMECNVDENLEEENRNLLVNNDDVESITQPLLKKSTESNINSLGVR